MKTCSFLAIGLLLALTIRAQDTIPLYSMALAKQRALRRPGIGVDLYQTAWIINSAARHESPATYAYPVSVTLYLPIKTDFQQDRTVYINAGYVAYGGTMQRNIYQAGGSIHVRAGVELTRSLLILGYGGLLTGWSGQGSFYFRGSTFGDYQEATGRPGGLALAGEGHIGCALPLGSRLSLRTFLRGSVLYRLITTQHDLYAPHLSGIDWHTANPVGLAISLQANLVFRL